MPIDPRVQELIDDVMDANGRRRDYSMAQQVALGRKADALAADLSAQLLPVDAREKAAQWIFNRCGRMYTDFHELTEREREAYRMDADGLLAALRTPPTSEGDK